MEWLGPLFVSPEERQTFGMDELGIVKERLSSDVTLFQTLESYQLDIIVQAVVLRILNFGEKVPCEPDDGLFVVVGGRVELDEPSVQIEEEKEEEEEEHDDGNQSECWESGAHFRAERAPFLKVKQGPAYLLVLPKDLCDGVLNLEGVAAGSSSSTGTEREEDDDTGADGDDESCGYASMEADGTQDGGDDEVEVVEAERSQSSSSLPPPPLPSHPRAMYGLITSHPLMRKGDDSYRGEVRTGPGATRVSVDSGEGGGGSSSSVDGGDEDDEDDSDVEFMGVREAAAEEAVGREMDVDVKAGSQEPDEAVARGKRKNKKKRSRVMAFGGGQGGGGTEDEEEEDDGQAQQQQGWEEEEERRRRAMVTTAVPQKTVRRPTRNPEAEAMRPTRSRYQPQRAVSVSRAAVCNDNLRAEVLALVEKRLCPFKRLDLVEILDENGRPHNPQFEAMRKLLSKAPEIIVFHGSTRNCCKQIALFNFDPRHATQRNQTGNNHIFFATDPRVADKYAKSYALKGKHKGYYQKNMIVSRLLMAQDSLITTTGCVGGTVKVHESSLPLLRPIFRVKYFIKGNPERKLLTKFLGKENLEVAPALKDLALKAHLLTIGRVQVQDFDAFGR